MMQGGGIKMGSTFKITKREAVSIGESKAHLVKSE
jgi:hypothetical protein